MQTAFENKKVTALLQQIFISQVFEYLNQHLYTWSLYSQRYSLNKIMLSCIPSRSLPSSTIYMSPQVSIFKEQGYISFPSSFPIDPRILTGSLLSTAALMHELRIFRFRNFTKINSWNILYWHNIILTVDHGHSKVTEATTTKMELAEDLEKCVIVYVAKYISLLRIFGN